VRRKLNFFDSGSVKEEGRKRQRRAGREKVGKGGRKMVNWKELISMIMVMIHDAFLARGPSYEKHSPLFQLNAKKWF